MMLQQTQVNTVIPYFERWMKMFPTIDLLSKQSEDVVLKAWEGLGYYSRARNILKTAKKICLQYNGEFPSSMHALKELPGIGNYSAGAILSFAFDKRAVFLDTNMERVMVRLYAIEKHSKHALTNEALEHLERILPHRKTRLESPFQDMCCSDGARFSPLQTKKSQMSPMPYKTILQNI